MKSKNFTREAKLLIIYKFAMAHYTGGNNETADLIKKYSGMISQFKPTVKLTSIAEVCQSAVILADKFHIPENEIVNIVINGDIVGYLFELLLKEEFVISLLEAADIVHVSVDPDTDEWVRQEIH